MPFRRKTEDELFETRKPFKVPKRRGPLGPIPLMLIGYSVEAFVPFDTNDPDGALYLRLALSRQAAVAGIQLPTTPRIEEPDDAEAACQIIEELWAAE